MQLVIGFNVNMWYMRKNCKFHQADLQTDWLSQNIVLYHNFRTWQSICLVPLYALTQSSNYETIENFNVHSYKNFVDLVLFRKGSVCDFKTGSLFFLVTFAVNFDTIIWQNPFFNTYSVKPAPTSNKFV